MGTSLLKYYSNFLMAASMCISGLLHAQVRTSVLSGNWNNASTWDCNCVPANNEDAVIATGTTVSLTNNTNIQNLTIEAGAILDNGGKKIDVKGNYKVDGTHDGKGDIRLSGAGATISGTGTVPRCKKVFINGGDKTVLSGTDIRFMKADVRINGAFTVTNKGTVTIEKKLIGNNGNSTWVNDSNAVLHAGRDVLNTGTLIASAPGNLVHYYRNKDQNIKNPSAGAYWHLKVSGGGVKFLQANTVIKGDLLIQFCGFDPNGNSINIAGDWTNTNGQFFEGTQTVVFDGQNDQTVTATYGETFYDMVVNKSGGQLLMNDNDTVANSLLMTSGDIGMGAHILTLGTGLLNPGTLTHTSGTVIGKLERWLVNTATTYLFPVGTASHYRPANILCNTLVPGSLIMQFKEEFPTDNGLPVYDAPDSIYNTFSEGYWDLGTPNTLSSGNYDINLNGNGFTSFAINPSTRILSRPDTGSAWTVNGNHQPAVPPVAYRNNLNMLPVQLAFGDTAFCNSYPLTSAITGADSVCTGEAGSPYSVAFTSGSVYNWTIIGGVQASGGNTNSITVDWGSTGMSGSVTVQEYSGCAFGSPVTMQVDIHTLPTSPITGNSSVASGDTLPYSVTPRPGYTYTWSATGGVIVSGQGTDTVTVAWGSAGSGQINVVASSGCGNAPTVSLPVDIYDVINSIASGNWNATSTWDCACIPNQLSNVRINSGHTVTLTNKADVYHLIIKQGAFLADGGNRMRVQGNFTNDGNYQGNNRLEIRGTSNTLDGTGDMVGFSGEMRLKDGLKTIASSAVIYMPSADLRVEKNTTAINYGHITIGGNIIGKDAVSSHWINEASSYLSIGKALLATGRLTASAAENTVSYSGLFNQNIKQTVGSVYFHLDISGTSVKTMTSALDINGNISISSTLSSSGWNINLAGDWTNTGVYTAGTNTVAFDGSALQTITNTAGEVFFNLTTESGASVRIPAASSVTVSSALLNKGLLDNDGILYLPNGYVNQTGTLRGDGNHILTNGNWNNTGTFLSDLGTVTFQGSLPQTIQGPTTFYNLNINNASGVSIVADLHNLLNTMTLVSGTFNTNNALTLISDANGTAEIAAIPIGSADILGDITVQRYIPPGPYGWRFLSSPVSGRTLADWNDDFITSGFPGSDYPNFSFVSISGYDETILGDKNQGFVPPANITDPINPYDGFWCYLGPLPVTVDVTGPANKGNISFPVTYTDDIAQPPSEDGWNMIGNPYPCTIDWDSPNWTKSNMNNAVYIWRADLQNFASYVAGIGTNGGSRYIASSQGIWVQSFAPSPVLSITENCKAPVDQSYLRAASPSPGHYFKLKIANNNYADETAVRFHPLATDSFDYQYDAYKLFDIYSPAPYVATLMNTADMAINSYPVLNNDRTLWVRARVKNSGVYTFSIADLDSMPKSACLVLEDLLTNIVTDMRTDTSYSCFISDTTYAPRFLLHIGAPLKVETSDVSCSGQNDGSAIAEGKGSPPWTYIWKNAQDSVLQTSNSSTADTLYGLSSGMYKVEVTGGGGFCGTLQDTFEISEPLPIILQFTGTQASCYGIADGSLSIQSSGGVPPYAYQWNNGNTTQAVHNLSSGMYAVTVTDSQGCSATDSASVDEPPPLSDAVIIQGTSPDHCSGSAIASASGGTPPYQYLWDQFTGNQTGSHADSLCAGTYSVTVTDAMGCSITDSAVVVVTGTGQSMGSAGLSIYPNPNNGAFLIRNSGRQEKTLTIYNALGQSVYTRKVSGDENIRVSGLRKGIYCLVLSLENGNRLQTLPVSVTGNTAH